MSITVVARAAESTAIPTGVYAFVGDRTIRRDEIEANRNSIVPVILPGHGTPGEISGSIAVDRGAIVTLIAVEGFGGTVFSDLNRLDSSGNVIFTVEAPPDATEFLSWEGGSQPNNEDGLATLTADDDRQVIANYARMRGVLVESIGCAELGIGWDGLGYLAVGPLGENAQSADSLNSRQTGKDHPWVYVYNKVGTTFTFRTLPHPGPRPEDADFAATGFLRWESDGAGCGSNTECQIERSVNGAGDKQLGIVNSFTNELPKTDNGSDIGTITVANGFGCGECHVLIGDPPSEQTCDEFRAKLLPK